LSCCLSLAVQEKAHGNRSLGIAHPLGWTRLCLMLLTGSWPSWCLAVSG
jgi:hypothetical protein